MRIFTLLGLGLILLSGCVTKPELSQPLTVTVNKSTNWAVEPMNKTTKCYTDRQYVPLDIPNDIGSALVIKRKKNEDKAWLPPNLISVSKDCYLYVAVLSTYQGKSALKHEHLLDMNNAGWSFFSGLFRSTVSSNDKWQIYRLSISKGQINLGDTSSYPHTALIFMIGEKGA